MQAKWFGREPALVIQTVTAVVALLAGFGVPGVDDGTAAVATAFVAAAAAAWTALEVRPVGPAVFTGVITTGATLAAAFGLDLSQQQVGLVTATAAVLVTLWTRSQVTPIVASPAR